MTEEEVIADLDSEPKHIQEMLIRRALRMIYKTEVVQEDEMMFNNWRTRRGLHPLDENNLRP